MKTIYSLFFALLLFTGCSSTEFRAYEDGGRIYTGSGGSKETVDGVDIWRNGAPPRPYKILGIVDDTRRKNLFSSGGAIDDIVEEVQDREGDAAIILSQGLQQLGTFYSPGMAATTFRGSQATTTQMPGFAQTISDQVTSVAIIKYIAGTPPATAPSVENAAPQEASIYDALAIKYDEESARAAELARLARERAAAIRSAPPVK